MYFIKISQAQALLFMRNIVKKEAKINEMFKLAKSSHIFYCNVKVNSDDTFQI